jgi:hypothetical protein
MYREAGTEVAMRLAQAVLGITQYVVPGLLALGFGEVRRHGELVRILTLLVDAGREQAVERASTTRERCRAPRCSARGRGSRHPASRAVVRSA